MGGNQTKYVQLTLDVGYYLEHMEALFLQEAKHRFKADFFFSPNLCLDDL